LGCLRVDYTVHQIPTKVLLDIEETVKSHYFSQDSSSSNIRQTNGQLMKLVHRSLQAEPLRECEGHVLDLVGYLEHPDVVELLAFCHNLLLEGLGHSLSLRNLFVVYQVNKSG